MAEPLGWQPDKEPNWAKWTHFTARNTALDLRRLCGPKSAASSQRMLLTRDRAGLLPIHWAAIHNRSDLIEVMVLELGSPLRAPCRNRLLADGSALHLAAMNGSLEAAAMLFRLHSSGRPQHKNAVGAPAEQVPAPNTSWLSERDSEGQTALMRSAAPKSRRLDSVRELLLKNLWSLSGRPAEMALLLISLGSSWRELDSRFGMNLLHLAVVNDHDDIVSLLLVLDRPLLQVRAKLAPGRPQGPSSPPVAATPGVATPPEQSLDFETIDLYSEEASPLVAQVAEVEARKSVLARRQAALADGLSPLQLAIVYGRLACINLLWQASRGSGVTEPATKPGLKSLLCRASVSNPDELLKLVRRFGLKLALALDLSLIMLAWTPLYLSQAAPGRKHQSGLGLFLLSSSLTIMLLFRVGLKNPGYLRRGSVQYMRTLGAIVGPSWRQGRQSSAQTGPEPKPDVGGPADSLETVSGDPVQLVKLLCHRCRCVRNARSKHCNYCNHCVQDFDHHCIYLGCCVGRRNRLDFVLMLAMAALSSLIGARLMLAQQGRPRGFLAWFALLSVAKYAVLGLFSAFLNLRRACLGVTMFEEVRSKRLRRVFGPRGPWRQIEASHRLLGAARGSKPFWRYAPDRFLAGELPARSVLFNLREFANFLSLDDYLLAMLGGDTELARRIKALESGVGPQQDHDWCWAEPSIGPQHKGWSNKAK